MIFLPDTIFWYAIYKYPGMVPITRTKSNAKVRDLTGLDALLLNSMIAQDIPHKGYYVRVESDDGKYFRRNQKWEKIK